MGMSMAIYILNNLFIYIIFYYFLNKGHAHALPYRTLSQEMSFKVSFEH